MATRQSLVIYDAVVSQVDLREAEQTHNPSAGFLRVYANGGHIYLLDSEGNESQIDGGGGDFLTEAEADALYDAIGAAAAAQAASQPLDSDLTSIAGLSTTSYGRGLLTLANQAALQAEAASYTDEQAQDAVGGILSDSGDIDFTYDDGTPAITGAVKSDAVSNAKLANMAEATFKMRAAGAGTGDPIDGTATQAKTALAITTADISDFSAAASELLAHVAYAAGSDAALLTTSSTSFVDVSAANVVVTFTAPPSGNVLVVMSALCNPANSQIFWGVRDGTTNKTPEAYVTQVPNAAARNKASIKFTGLTPGNSYTWKMAMRMGTAVSGNLYTGPTFGQAIMEVWKL